jgi:hypothetical protein
VATGMVGYLLLIVLAWNKKGRRIFHFLSCDLFLSRLPPTIQRLKGAQTYKTKKYQNKQDINKMSP